MTLRHKTPAEPAKPVLTELAAATAELSRVEQHQRELVAQARFEGCSWAEVGAATGLSHHAARKRWHEVPDLAAGSQGDFQKAELSVNMGQAARVPGLPPGQ
jgi:hypothetical protein